MAVNQQLTCLGVLVHILFCGLLAFGSFSTGGDPNRDPEYNPYYGDNPEGHP